MIVSTSTTVITRAWRTAAPQLAEFTLAHLLNRDDVWGGYRSLVGRPLKTRADGTTYAQKSYTAPAVKDRGRVKLANWRIRRHYCGFTPEDVIGVHTTASNNTSRWGAIEVDRHDDDGNPEANWRAVTYWRDVLVTQGFTPLLSDSNGAG